jgi:hypothetical protein
MLTLAETPHALLSDICAALASIQDPRARHWLLFPGRGRAETVLKMWADRSGIAAHTQDVELRVLIEQAASANQHQRFDFDRLKLACASVLPEFAHLPDFPIRSREALTPISAQVLNWASAIANAIDVGLQCRIESERWPKDSFLSKIAAHPVVSATLCSHIGTLDPISFEESTRAWIEDWASRSGVPHLWIQLDAGIPAIQYERLQQFLLILSESYSCLLYTSPSPRDV